MSLIKSLFHKKEFNIGINEQAEDFLDHQEEQQESDNEPQWESFWQVTQEEVPDYDEEDGEYEVVEREILPEKIICPDCGGITLEGLDFCDKCGGELKST